MVTGRWLKVAQIKSEDYVLGEPVGDVAAMVREVKASGLSADVFSFSRRFTDPQPRYPYPLLWDNVAAIPLIGYEHWWECLVSNDLRRDVKRAEKCGVEIRVVPFDDDLVRGIKEVYDETPIRQGGRFWHYGKPLEVVKRENATYLDRAVFIGAFVGAELIGFVKIVFVDDLARLLQIVSKNSHVDKRPSNGLIAKAVEIAAARGCTYLTYGKYTYGVKRNSTLAQFKHRNGFKEILYPKYFVPLTTWGRMALMARLHLGLARLLPERLVYLLLDLRSRYTEWGWKRDGTVAASTAAPATPIAASTAGKTTPE